MLIPTVTNYFFISINLLTWSFSSRHSSLFKARFYIVFIKRKKSVISPHWSSGLHRNTYSQLYYFHTSAITHREFYIFIIVPAGAVSLMALEGYVHTELFSH